MWFGAHAFLWEYRSADGGLALLDCAAELGLDALEIALGDDRDLPLARLGERARALNLRIVCSPGGVWPMECDIALDDPSAQRRGLEWHRRRIDEAAGAGAVAYTGALYGHPGHVERRKPTEEEYRRIAGHLHALAEFAAGRGVALALEPMSHFRTHLVNTPEQAMRLIALADHRNLGVLLDTYHLLTEVRDFAAAIRMAAPRLWGLHACENDRGVPGGGLVPWAAVAGALRETGFAGYIGLESYNSGPSGLAASRGLFHDPCPDGDAFVRRGLAFLEGCLDANG